MEIQYEQLVTYWNGHANEAERKVVEAWKVEHSKLYGQWRTVWQEAGQLAETEPADVDKAWLTIKGKIQPQQQVKPHFTYWKHTAAAAVSLLLLASGWLLLNWEISVRANGEQAFVTLQDGSKVWLYPSSELAYPLFFWGKPQRKVKLRGEGYFQVTHNEAKPFFVEGELGMIQVLGTAFLVKTLPNSNAQTVQVTEGKVAFYPLDRQEAQEILRKGDEAIIKKNEEFVLKQRITNSNYRAWQTQEMYFEETPLPEALQVIEKVYGIKIMTDGAALHTCQLTGTFKKITADNMLNTLETLFGISVEKTGEKVYQLTGKGCP